jgi:AAA domain
MPDGTMTKRKSKLIGKPAEVIKELKPKILIFGASGVGKTSFAIQFPDVYFIDVEGGATQKEYREKLLTSRAAYLGPNEGASSFAVVMEQVKALATEEHDRKTLVIDSMSKLFANEIAREAERLADAGEKNKWSTDKKPAVNYMRQLVSWITRMDMNVILICGEISEWSKEGDDKQIGATYDCWPRLEYELDLAIRIAAAGGTNYAKVRKSRIKKFPKGFTFEWGEHNSYDNFADIYGRSIIEQEVVPVVCSTEEQLAEIQRLLDIVKLEDGTVEKWLAAANVVSWDEMPTERAEKAIDYLKSKLAA